MAILGVIVYRIIIVGLLHSMPYEVGKHAKIITSLTAAIINLIVIMALNVVGNPVNQKRPFSPI